MIVGNIHEKGKNLLQYPQVIVKALDYLRKTDFSQMADGKYSLDGDKCFVTLQRYQTRKMSECHPETHKKYIDIQYVVEGEEYLGWCAFNPELEIIEPYNEERDITFYRQLIPDSNIILAAGAYAILYPNDLHRPCGAIDDVPAPVTKVVVKIAVDSLKE